jgi:hypothetical protein
MTAAETCPDCGHAETDHAGAFGCQVELAPDELRHCESDDGTLPTRPR